MSFVRPHSRDVLSSWMSVSSAIYTLLKGDGDFMYADDTGEVVNLTDLSV